MKFLSSLKKALVPEREETVYLEELVLRSRRVLEVRSHQEAAPSIGEAPPPSSPPPKSPPPPEGLLSTAERLQSLGRCDCCRGPLSGAVKVVEGENANFYLCGECVAAGKSWRDIADTYRKLYL